MWKRTRTDSHFILEPLKLLAVLFHVCPTFAIERIKHFKVKQIFFSLLCVFVIFLPNCMETNMQSKHLLRYSKPIISSKCRLRFS